MKFIILGMTLLVLGGLWFVSRDKTAPKPAASGSRVSTMLEGVGSLKVTTPVSLDALAVTESSGQQKPAATNQLFGVSAPIQQSRDITPRHSGYFQGSYSSQL